MVDFSLEPFDAAISYGSPNWPGTIAHHLMDMDVVPVCSPKLLASKRVNTPGNIASLPLLHQMSGNAERAEMEHVPGVGAAIHCRMLAHGRHNDPVWQAEVAQFQGGEQSTRHFRPLGPGEHFRTFTVREVPPRGK
jgi:hypothetical protein